MTPQPQRPRLAAALAAVTAIPASHWGVYIDQPNWLRWMDRGPSIAARGPDGRWLTAIEPAPLTADGPQAAWEALHLAGLVPESALDDPRRRFVVPDRLVAQRIAASATAQYAGQKITSANIAALKRDLSRALWGATTAPLSVAVEPDPIEPSRVNVYIDPAEPSFKPVFDPCPATVADCVAFASDWPAILAAEEIARQHLGDHPVTWRVAVRDHRAPPAEARWPDDWRGDVVAANAATLALGYHMELVGTGIIRMVAPPLATTEDPR